MATPPIIVRVLIAASLVAVAVGCGGPPDKEGVCRWVLLRVGPGADAPDNAEDLASKLDFLVERSQAFEAASGSKVFAEAAHNLEVAADLLRADAPETAAGFIQEGLAGYAAVCEPYWDQWSQLR